MKNVGLFAFEIIATKKSTHSNIHQWLFGSIPNSLLFDQISWIWMNSHDINLLGKKKRNVSQNEVIKLKTPSPYDFQQLPNYWIPFP